MEKPVEITYDMLANKGRRFANNLIDSVICVVLTLIIGEIGNGIYDNYGYNGLAIGILDPNEPNMRFSMLQSVITIIFYGLFESFTGRTIGKYITGTKVVMRDGTRPDSVTIFIRTICRLIPLEALSFLGRHGIGWHDMFSKTLVVDINKYNHSKRVKNGTDTIGQEDI